MSFGSGGGGTEVQQLPGGVIGSIPLQDNLANAALNMLTQALPQAHAGAGYQMLPRNPFGQVQVAGPNPTVFGDPFNASYAQNYFGPNSGAGQGAMGQAQGGQSGSGSGGSASPPQGGLGSIITGQAGQGQPPTQPGGGPMQGPPAQGQQGEHPMVGFLRNMLQPGTLGSLFAAYAQSQHQPQQGQGQPPTQQPQQNSQPQQQQGFGALQPGPGGVQSLGPQSLRQQGG